MQQRQMAREVHGTEVKVINCRDVSELGESFFFGRRGRRNREKLRVTTYL